MTIQEIIFEVAKARGITARELCGPDRSKRYADARREAARRLREHGLSLPNIGRHLGGRDHSTISHYLRTPSPRRSLAVRVAQLEQDVKSLLAERAKNTALDKPHEAE